MEVATITLKEILEEVMENTSVQDKVSICRTHTSLGASISYQDPFDTSLKSNIGIGDDCAAIPDGQGGYLLFASEGIIPSFVNNHPWFAGYSAVMVNISDVCAMGGLPMALTDVLWLKDREDGEQIWKGMQAAAENYGVPIVGGHTCYHSDKKHVAVSILGKASKLLTSYDAEPGDELLMAIDLNGKYFQEYPFWNASTESKPEKLQRNMRLLREIAENGWSKTAKDISMGGLLGTLAMLLHTSRVGAHIDLQTVPKPTHVPWTKWLLSFPSYGYLLTAKSEATKQIIQLFEKQGIVCASIGRITTAKGLSVSFQDELARVL